MHCPTALLLALVLTATAAAAAADGPLWQIPGRVSKSANPTTDGPDNQCSMSTFDGIGEGEILISDCEAILDALEGEDQGFILALSIWRDSTALEDHFWTYVTSGTCQFALKRVDGLNDTVYMSDGDFKELIRQSIGVGNGTYLQTVKGTVPCISVTELDSYAQIEWSLRQTGNAN